jgi:hypothetical protein
MSTDTTQLDLVAFREAVEIAEENGTEPREEYPRRWSA